VGEQRVERRLAAILAADVVGYSRLMGANEVGTLRALKALREELVDPALARRGGRIVKLTGDGILIEFASVVDAVACAVEIQRAMARRNADAAQEHRIDYRIGINIGDVIVDGDDLYGDGVNVAARLQALAEPGGIWISGTVQEHVRDKLPFAFADQGEQAVKNIVRPVRVYALDPDAVAALSEGKASLAVPGSTRRDERGMTRRRSRQFRATRRLGQEGRHREFERRGEAAGHRPDHLSIVVLPFANRSGDPAQDYLGDVITDELTTALSRIRGSFVIARSTAFTYKGKAVDVKRIGQDLGVRYVLEGSAQQSGNRVRVNAQLISAETGAHLWADQFDTDRGDLLTMQDEIVTRLARALELEMGLVEAARVARTRPGNQDAEDLALRCQAGFDNSATGSAEREAAYDLCERALQIDQSNVLALSIAAFKYAIWASNGLSEDPQADIQRAEELAARALALEPNNYRAHVAVAKSEVSIFRGRPDEAVVEAERSLALNPSFMPAYAALCSANTFMGRPEKMLEIADRAIRLSPRDPLLYVFYQAKGVAYAMLKEDAQAIEWLRRVVAMAPQFPNGRLALAIELALNGQEPEARDMLQRYLSLKATLIRTIAQYRAWVKTLSDNPAYVAMAERAVEGLRKAGMSEE
jgi:adenylate cyclase